MNLPETQDATRRGKHILLSVVVPVYNEEAVLALTHETILESLGGNSEFDLEIVYVNDGSKDASDRILREIAEADGRVKVITFSRNFGHQPAVSAGLAHVKGDAVAVIDGDLQDPPSVIVDMLEKWREGFGVVYGIRSGRKESLFARFMYAGFYRLFRRLADIDMPLDTGDFALMDRAVVDGMNSLPERNRFVRGLRAWTGFSQTGLVYERAARAHGETKYPFSKLMKLAFDGIFNFSTMPLSIIFGLGIVTALVSIVLMGVLFSQWLLDYRIFGWSYREIPGFTTLILTILFFSGMQLASIGILGEYIGRIYQEVKMRPTYILKEVYQNSEPPADTGQDRE